VLVGDVVRIVGLGNQTLDAVNDAVVIDSEAIAVELAACLGRRSPCRRSSKSSLLGPKSRVMKCAVCFHGDGDVDRVIMRSPSSRDIPDTLQILEKFKSQVVKDRTCATRARRHCCNLRAK
jgi:hypothetical protein